MEWLRNWVGDWGPLLTLVSALALLGVTFWYARITSAMATAARDAADESTKATTAAQQSAKASEDMVTVAKEAASDSARATAAAERSAGATQEMATLAKSAASDSARAIAAAEDAANAARDAATVAQSQIKPNFVGRQTSVSHGELDENRTPCIQLKSTGDSVVVQRVRSRRSFRKLNDYMNGEAELVDEEFEPYSYDYALPMRLHEGETLLLTHAALQDGGEEFARFVLEIEYTFTESGGAGGTRRLAFDSDSKHW